MLLSHKIPWKRDKKQHIKSQELEYGVKNLIANFTLATSLVSELAITDINLLLLFF